MDEPSRFGAGSPPAVQAGPTPPLPSPDSAWLPRADKVSPEFRRKLIQGARQRGWAPEDLMGVMAFETGRTFLPKRRTGRGPVRRD